MLGKINPASKAVPYRVRDEETKRPNQTVARVAAPAFERRNQRADKSVEKSISINAKLASRDISRSEFFDILKFQIGDFDNKNLATCWYRLGRKKFTNEWLIHFDDANLSALKKLTLDNLSNFTDSNIARTVWGFAVVGCKDKEIINKFKLLIEERLHRANQFTGEDLSDIANAFARLNCTDAKFIDKLKKAILPNLSNGTIDSKRLQFAFKKFGIVDDSKPAKGGMQPKERDDRDEGKHSKDSVQKNDAVFIEMKPKMINENLINEDNCERFFTILKNYFSNFDMLNIITFWHELAMHAGKDNWNIEFSDPRLANIIKETPKILDKIDDRGLANITWSLAKIGCKDTELILALKKEVEKRLRTKNQFEGQGLSNMVWAFAKFECRDPKLIDLLKTEIEAGLKDPKFYTLDQFSSLVWAFAKLEYKNDDFIEVLKNSLRDRFQEREDFNGHHLSNFLWAFAKFGCKDYDFIGELIMEIDPLLESPDFFNEQGLANIIWAMSKFDGETKKLKLAFEEIPDFEPYDGRLIFERDNLNSVAERCRYNFIHKLRVATESKLNQGDFKGYGLSTIILAFAKLDYKDPSFIERLREEVESKLQIPDFFDSQAITNIIWAFTHFGYQNSEFIKLLQSFVKKELEENPNFFTGPEIASICCSFAKLECKDKDFIEALKQSIVYHLDNPWFFDGESISNISWAFVNFECTDLNFILPLKEFVESKLEIDNFFACIQLSCIAWAFAKFNYTKDHKFINALAKSALSVKEDFEILESRVLTNIIFAFARFGCADKTLIGAFKDAVKLKLRASPPLFNQQELLIIHQSFTMFKCEKDTPFMNDLEKALNKDSDQKTKSSELNEGNGLEGIVFGYFGLDVSGSEIKEQKFEIPNHRDIDFKTEQPEATHRVKPSLASSAKGQTASGVGAAVLSKTLVPTMPQSSVTATAPQLKTMAAKGDPKKPVIQNMELSVFLELLKEPISHVEKAIFLWDCLAKNENSWKVLFNDQRLDALKAYTFSNLNKFDPNSLSNIVLAISMLNCTDEKFINAMKDAVKKKLALNVFNGLALSNIKLAFTKNFTCMSDDDEFSDSLEEALSLLIKTSNHKKYDGVVTFKMNREKKR